MRRIIAAMAIGSALTACGQTVEERSASGGLGGVAAGAVVAGPVGALVGAGVGAGAGAATTRPPGETARDDDQTRR